MPRVILFVTTSGNLFYRKSTIGKQYRLLRRIMTRIVSKSEYKSSRCNVCHIQNRNIVRWLDWWNFFRIFSATGSIWLVPFNSWLRYTKKNKELGTFNASSCRADVKTQRLHFRLISAYLSIVLFPLRWDWVEVWVLLALVVLLPCPLPSVPPWLSSTSYAYFGTTPWPESKIEFMLK